jgi:hypothetical protein
MGEMIAESKLQELRDRLDQQLRNQEMDRRSPSKILLRLRERIDAQVPAEPKFSWMKRSLIHRGRFKHSNTVMKLLLASGVLLLPGRDYPTPTFSLEKESQERFLSEERIPGSCILNRFIAYASGSVGECWSGYAHDQGTWWAHVWWRKKDGEWDFNAYRGAGQFNAYFGVIV